jgi:hypothetical protein
VRVILAALLAVPLAGAATYPGVKPRPAFATPGQAAYCAVEQAGLEDARAELRCWNPRNGLWLTITWNGRRAEKGAATAFPQIAHGLTKLLGYRPRAPVLGFGRRWRLRCAARGDVATCRGRGAVAFTCASARTGLTCRNAAGHGFWLGRPRGSRVF